MDYNKKYTKGRHIRYKPVRIEYGDTNTIYP